MVLDNERCSVSGCTYHVARPRKTSTTKRNSQIAEDYWSGQWTSGELCLFWGLSASRIYDIVSEVGVDGLELLG